MATVLRPPDPIWVWPDPDPARVAGASDLSSLLGIPEALCRVLAVRGLHEPEAAKRFLRPLVEHLHPAEQLPDATRAAERIGSAIRGGEGILVHGDYDVDGICGTALVTRYLGRLGAKVTPFVPHRTRDGYDLGRAGLEAAAESGAGLLITVDCGISAAEAVRQANASGLDVIVTDHHTPPAELPPALAVVNPKRAGSEYPDPGLSGTGVAFKLCHLVGGAFGVPEEESWGFLDLVALATIADLVPLQGENRALVRIGMRALRRTPSPGLRALIAASGVEPEALDAGKVGWVLGPRINAAGRVGEAGTALRLLLTEDHAEAAALADQLERANTSRRAIERSVVEEALDRLGERFEPDTDYGVVVEGEGWHPGVIGIVASRLVDRIHRPVVVVSLDGERGRGSARSIPGFDLHGAVAGCAAHLERFGGHAAAAGMDLRREQLDPFRARFGELAREALEGRALAPELEIDLALDPAEASLDLVAALRHLGPFGISNRRPVFVSRDLEMAAPAREVGTGHLKLSLATPTGVLDGIGFGLVARRPPHTLASGRWDVVYHLEENTWRGRTSVQAQVLDLAPSATESTRADLLAGGR